MWLAPVALDGLGKCGKRADVKHGDPSKRSLEVLFCRDYRPAGEAVKAGLRGAIQPSSRLESRQKLLLGPGRGPRRQIIAHRRLGQAGVPAEQALRLGFRKSGQMGGFEIGRAAIGRLDRLGDFIGQNRRQAEANMDRRQQALLHHLVVAAEHRLERRDHVADDIFRRVVQQRREPEADVDARHLLAHHGFHQQRVLRHREDMRAAGLPVPARDARQAMGDVGDLDIERRGVEQIEPPPRQHPLPGAGGDACGRFSRRHLALRRGLRSLPLQFSWQKQVTRWSLTMPVACMKA